MHNSVSMSVMKKTRTKEQQKKSFEGYEKAREESNVKNPAESSEKSVKAATNRINPDGNMMDRG